ncbi:MAG: hypothetical protein KW804_01210 [Candidatus Doudnabacteria bacterium]|nr:hypothetical protein [Candidatus Doudnabacteria bacterium]
MKKFCEKINSYSVGKKIELFFCFLLLLSIAYFHINFMRSAGPLWRDEASSAELASRSLSDGVYYDLMYDSYPPGSTIVFHFWQKINSTDQGYRILGLVIGLGILAGVWFCARTLRLGFPFLTLGLLGFNATVVRFGDTIRPHGLGVLFLLLAFASIWKLTKEKFTWLNLISGIICAIASVQMMYQNAFFIFGLCLAGVVVSILSKDWKKSIAILSCGAIAGLTLIPYISFIRHAQKWSTVAQYLYEPNAIWPVLKSALGTTGSIYVFILAILIAGGVLIFFVLKNRHYKTEHRDLFLFCLITLPSVIIFLGFLQRVRVPTQPWYFLPLMSVLAISLDAFYIAVIPQKLFRTAVVLIAIIPVVPGVLSDTKIRSTNIDIIAERISSSANAKDLVIIEPWQVGVGFNRQYSGDTKWLTLPPLTDNTIFRYDLIKEKILEEDPVKSTLELAETTLRNGNDVWVITSTDMLTQDFKPKPRPELRTYMNPYIHYWSWLLNQTMNHTEDRKLIDTTIDQTISSLEHLRLIKYHGWHD